jgi:hypothetical protein
VPYPNLESRPRAEPDPHPTHRTLRTRVLGHRRPVQGRSRAHIPHTAAFRTAVPRLSGPCTVRWSSYNTGRCTLGSVRHRDSHPQPCCTPITSVRAHLGLLVRRWVRRGVGIRWGARAPGRRLRLALRGHVRIEGADGDRCRTVLDPGGPAAARSSPRRRAARRCRKFRDGV